MMRRIDISAAGSEKGTSALVVVLAATAAALLIGGGLFTLGVGESDLVDYTVDSARAFYLAEAGQEHAKAWLDEMAELDPPVYPLEGSLDDLGLGGGEYDVAISTYPSGSPWLTQYEVVATGEIDGVTRSTRSIMQQETFARYLYFSDQSSYIWFTTGDSLNGPVHINGTMRIDGDPWFGMKVTSSSSTIEIRSGSNPTFVEGCELGLDDVPLPVPATLTAEMRQEAQDGGVLAGSLPGRDALYELVLGRSGAYGTASYRSYSRSGGSYRWSSWTDVDLLLITGIMWFDEPIRVHGVLDGELTVGCSEDISIWDDITYEASSRGSGPDPGCDDMLGLVSMRDVIVANSPPNQNDCEIHAHMIALDESFTAQDYDSGSPRGDLILWGGFVQEKIGAVGMFTHGGGIIHGYSKDYNFDRRFLTRSPPGYPYTESYVVVSWSEIVSGQ